MLILWAVFAERLLHAQKYSQRGIGLRLGRHIFSDTVHSKLYGTGTFGELFLTKEALIFKRGPDMNPFALLSWGISFEGLSAGKCKNVTDYFGIMGILIYHHYRISGIRPYLGGGAGIFSIKEREKISEYWKDYPDGQFEYRAVQFEERGLGLGYKLNCGIDVPLGNGWRRWFFNIDFQWRLINARVDGPVGKDEDGTEFDPVDKDGKKIKERIMTGNNWGGFALSFTFTVFY